MRVIARLLAASAATVMLVSVAACDADTSADRPTGPADGLRLYGSDGNMSNALGASFKDHPGILSGMKGTAPLSPLSDDFKSRLRGVVPGLADFNYAGQSYDAVMVSALAVEIARTTNAIQVARYLPGVATGPATCTTPPECLALIAQGQDIGYRGVSLRSAFTDAGEPVLATYGTLHFDRENKIDDGKTEYVGAGDDKAATKAREPAPVPASRRPVGPPLRIATLLPKTGQLAGMYPPMIAGARLAVQELNAAGGILGRPVELVESDDGTNPTKAKESVEELLAQRVHVIVGAGASGVSKEVIPRVTGAGVLMISPCATSDELISVPDHGLFFRTAAPDQLQARALADIIMRDGIQRLFLVARDDSWGQGLLKNLKENLEAAGIRPDNLRTLTYRPGETADDRPDLSQLPAQVKEFVPDGMVILGFDESAAVIGILIDKGIRIRQ
jgi:ABC-type branched-subunit amino acid transport system substrate-binding protein